MNIRLLTILLLLGINTLKSQNVEITEIIYLKNGSILKGQVTEWVPNKSLTVLLGDSSIFVCNIDDIERVKRNPQLAHVADSKKSTTKNQNLTRDTRGYESNLSLGYGLAWEFLFSFYTLKALKSYYFCSIGPRSSMDRIDVS